MALSLRARRLATVLLPVAFAAACSSDDTVAPPTPVAGSFEVNATTGWAYVSLRDSAIVTPADPTTSSAWDIAFFGLNAMLNGGQAGPGGVTGFCICQNTGATPAPTNQQLYAADTNATLRAAELADFAAVTSVPAGATFVSDVLSPAISGWVTGTGAAAALATGKAWFVRNADGATVAKLRFTALQGATATTAGRVTLEFATAATGSAAAFGPSQTLEVDLATGAKLVDLNTGAVVTSGNDWDLKLEGYTVRINGGVSGSGQARAVELPTGETYASIAPNTIPPQALASDVYNGVFADSPWRYNLVGNNKVTPTYDVYLVRRDGVTYKLQVTSYYNATGEPRRISFRYVSL